MKKTWRRCPICNIFTDSDEKNCPQFGAKEGHELEDIELNQEEVANLRRQGKLFTKHMALIGT